RFTGKGSDMHIGERVSGISWFLTSRALKRLAISALLALALVSVAGARGANAAPTPTPDCTNGGVGPVLKLTIINNTTDYNIYPVVRAGTPEVANGPKNVIASQWMQACFRVSYNNLETQRWPRDSQYRFYVNCCGTGENGIPPNGSVTITLPFYSPLI